MKNLILLFVLISTTAISQTYRYGEITRETYDNSWHLINREMYAYNAAVTVNEDKSYSIVCKAIAYGVDTYKLKFVKNTGKGAKYKDDSKGEFYLEDSLDPLGTLKLTSNVNKNFVVLTISNLKKQQEE